MARKRVNPVVKRASGMPSFGASQFVVAGYIRVSTEEQAKSGLGLGDQRHRILGMAMAKGWPEPVWYSDEGISGTKDSTKRQGLARLMQDVKVGAVQAVITLDISRIARRARLVMDFVDEMTRAGAEFISCKESFDTSTPQGQFVLFMFAALAQLERDQIAQRTRAALDEHNRRDGETGGGMPYGYARDESGVRVDLSQSRIIRRIFAMRAQKATLRAIAAELNRRRYKSPHGKRWHHSSVAAVLLNESYYRGAKRGASEVCWPVILRDESEGSRVESGSVRAIAG